MTIRIAPIILSFSLIAFGGAAAATGEAKQQGANKQPAASGAAQTGSAMSAKRLIGTDVIDAQGADMGEIKEVVLDLHNGRVHAAVVEFGGFLGIGDKQYAFPVSQLKPAQGDKLTLNVSKEKLKDEQGFDKNKWPGMGDEYWGRVGGKAAAGGTKAQGQKVNLYRASELIGQEVHNKNGQQVGEIGDIVLSSDRAKIQHIVLERKDGGEARLQPKQLSLGTGDRLVVDMPAAKSKAGSAAGGASGTAAPQKSFSELDKDNDGRLSREEWESGQAAGAGTTKR